MSDIDKLRREMQEAHARAVQASTAARTTREAWRKAVDNVTRFGAEPVAGSVIRFVRTLRDKQYSYAALHVHDGWFLTGDAGDPFEHSHGPIDWGSLCDLIDVGSLRVATGWSTATADAVPAFREQVASATCFSATAMGDTMFARSAALKPGEFFDAQGNKARSFLIDEPIVAVDPAVSSAAPGSVMVGGQTGQGKAAWAQNWMNWARTGRMSGRGTPVPGALFTVASRDVVRPSKTSPGEESVTVYEVHDTRTEHSDAVDVVATFEGEDAYWRACQSAAARDRNARKALREVRKARDAYWSSLLTQQADKS